jgi:hypothetical protein
MVHLASCIFNAMWAAASAACPRLMPPSLGGTAEFIKIYGAAISSVRRS